MFFYTISQGSVQTPSCLQTPQQGNGLEPQNFIDDPPLILCCSALLKAFPKFKNCLLQIENLINLSYLKQLKALKDCLFSSDENFASQSF